MKEIIGIFLVLISTIGTLLGIFFYENSREKSDTFTIIAMAPERGNWDPEVLKVPAGKDITIIIKNEDVVSHGFIIPELDLFIREIKAGELSKIKWRFEKGQYLYMCGIWCSDYHMYMIGKIIAK
ncbi:cupredoxin domain-containing protein [Candidatus Aminicenantes bacterium AH-873-B07]|jgi:heme/copper-type cytochrome/quinol oxidase subunit 2|nr:cupredoxin domain-containing protein [Candidatus Aminicenantes bacterium AH-873-B07]